MAEIATSGVGTKFLSEVNAALARVSQSPEDSNSSFRAGEFIAEEF